MRAFSIKLVERILVLWRRVNYACRNLTVHGPSFLVRKDVHFIYRLIYFIIYINVWWIAVATILRYYNHYQENTIRFTTRTDYLDWNTTFPAISLCEMANVEKVFMQSEKLKENANGKLDHYIREITFFTGTCHSCVSTCEEEPICTLNYSQIIPLFRAKCKDMFMSCFWNGIPFDCCNNFLPIPTEYGTCYSINSLHTKNQQLVHLTSSTQHELVSLEVILSHDYEVFLHSPEDIPFWNMEYDRRMVMVYGSQATVIFSIMDIINEPEVAMTTPEVRRCRFIEEVPENYLAYNKYSYSVCITQCRIDAQLELCNCTHHLSPIQYKDRYCDLEGLKCLTNNYDILSKLQVPDTNRTGLECDCLPSCTEPDYNVVTKKFIEPRKEVKAGTTKFILSNRPYERLTRQVARTPLDLVVAMGNCFGLCFGGSLLSIVEVVYYLCFKKWKYVKGK
ncbi:sodium channel protein Nach-like [Ostrinia nubilalis]|uniref:sodium channel protein Nach-like n=1 Tax=Ostrinia nubilalis TaxID=29057 RepID=UPI0030823279